MNIERIKQKTEEYFKTPINKKGREESTVMAKRVFVYIAREMGYTFQEVADYIGKSKSNAIHHYKTTHYFLIGGRENVREAVDSISGLEIVSNKLANVFKERVDLRLVPKNKTEEFINRVNLIIKSYNYKYKDNAKIYNCTDNITDLL